MIDDSSEMTSMQQKLASQIPTFFQALADLPDGMPNLHVAVVSSDMGAPALCFPGTGAHRSAERRAVRDFDHT